MSLPDLQHLALVVALLALYGVLFFLEAWITRRQPLRFAQVPIPGVALRPCPAQASGKAEGPVLRSPAPAGSAVEGLSVHRQWLPLAYLLLQSGLVIGLLLDKAVQDFFALLFIPLPRNSRQEMLHW